MACNPTLCAGPGGVAAPAPFAGELPLLLRDGVEFELDGLERCALGLPAGTTRFTQARLYLSTVRLVLVCCKPGNAPLRAFDAPLAYVRGERFNQPIFGCNNLSGSVFSVGEEGGPAGSLPPHTFKIYFREGGCGTLLPLFFNALQQAREAAQSPLVAPRGAMLEMRDLRTSAYLDPNDPTLLYVPEDTEGSDVTAPDAYPHATHA